MLTAQVALKEWAVVLDAMARGEHLLLVRKGGLADAPGGFDLRYREFFLYPTWEHQKSQSIRTTHQARLKKLSPPADSKQVPFGLYAGVAYSTTLEEPAPLKELEKYHIWTPEFFEEKMRYRKNSPLLVLVIRAYRVKPPIVHLVRPEDAGCHSWVDLAKPISVEGLEPVVENRQFRSSLTTLMNRLDPKTQ